MADAGAAIPPGLVDRLAADPVWLELIHAERDRGDDRFEPAVRGDDFYLSDPSRLSPAAELDATFAAFARAGAPSRPIDPDNDPRCLFPARRLWLQERARAYGVTIDGLDAPRCPAFERWLDLDDVESLSLLHVSGFFGNPASAFGHLLMRIDKRGGDGTRGLDDLGVNFGARVPPQDGSLAYMLKGIFGGYDAGFLQQGFHLHDAVYSATEQRDMWAYELGLERAERDLVLSHLWELSRVRFDYRFFKHNCAWNLSALLELVLDERLRPEWQPWHLPQSVFERLEDIDAGTRPGLIGSVSFVPSSKREAVAAFDALAPADARLANVLIADGLEVDGLESAPSDVLDFLLGWIDYRAAVDAANGPEPWRSRKGRVLAARLAQPVSTPGPAPPGLPRPAGGPRSRAVRIGTESVSGDARLVLGASTYAYDLLGSNRGSLDDAGFRLLDLSLGLDDDGVDFRGIDLIAVENLAPPAPIAGESRHVWRASLSVVGDDPTCLNCSDVVLEGGLGRGARFPEAAPGEGIAYVFADVSLGTDRSLAGPAAGIVYRPGSNVALRIEGRWLAASDGNDVPAASAELGWQPWRQGFVELAAVSADAVRSLRTGISLRW